MIDICMTTAAELLVKLRALVAKLEQLHPKDRLDSYAVGKTGEGTEIFALMTAEHGLEYSLLADELSYSSTPLEPDYNTPNVYDKCEDLRIENTHIVFVACSAHR